MKTCDARELFSSSIHKHSLQTLMRVCVLCSERTVLVYLKPDEDAHGTVFFLVPFCTLMALSFLSNFRFWSRTFELVRVSFAISSL